MNKTVYFLGAGASAGSDFELPTMEGFFKAEHFKSGRYPKLREFIRTLYPHTSFKNVNLEDVITHLELSLEGFGCTWATSNPIESEAKQELSEYIFERLSIKPINGGKGCKKHQRLITGLLASEDTIISLNYDLIFEESYKEAHGDSGSRLFYRYRDLLANRATLGDTMEFVNRGMPREGFFLKLHGSVDWIYCPNSLCNFHQQFFPTSEADEKIISDICPSCGTRLESVIVPPTIRKSYEKFPKLGFIWQLAFAELKLAQKLIMIGMSLPDSDYYLRWLIKESVRQREDLPELTIVNIDRDIIQKTKKIIGVEKATWFDGFENFVEEEKGESV